MLKKLKDLCVSVDTRTLKPGSLYVALKGPNFDGHDFVPKAAQHGAVGAVVSREMISAIPLYKVKDTFLALGELAKLRRNSFNIPIVALTGSCGKTTTKTMLASILNNCGKTLATEKNLNNNIGVPLTLLRLTKEEKFAVIEIGANQVGEIAYATRLVVPTCAIITNANPVHLEGFGSLDGVARVKGDILQGLTADGTAVLNRDDKYFSYWRNLLKPGQKCLSFAKNNQADVMAQDIELNTSGLSFALLTPLGNKKLHLFLTGEHNVMNALAAAAAAIAVGAPLTAIQNGLEEMTPVENRLIKRRGKNGALLLDDSYNANPASMQAAMEVLLLYPGEKIMVIGDMAELGSFAEEYHYKLGVKARKLGITKLYALGSLTPLTVEAFGKGAEHFTDRGALKRLLQSIARQDVVFLFKGSHVNRMWEFVTDLVEEKRC